MTDVVSIAEVQASGVTLEAHEAVAIAQQLIASLRTPEAVSVLEPPFGPPTTRNVYVTADGRAICRACETTPAVSEMAVFLQSLLSPNVHVPGGLRYALARAFLDVDVPPFDSLDDFSETLARYERGARGPAIRRVVDRVKGRRAVVPMAVVERRRRAPSTALRRALREADAQLYMQRAATESLVVVPHPTPAPQSMRKAAAFIAAGLAMIALGEIVDLRDTSVPLPRVAPIAAVEPGTEPRTENLEPRTLNLEPRTLKLEPRTENRELKTLNAELRTPNPVRRVSRPPRARVVQRARSRKESKGVFDRLRLGWLRNAFSPRSS